jgi:hypothetical protein
MSVAVADPFAKRYRKSSRPLGLEEINAAPLRQWDLSPFRGLEEITPHTPSIRPHPIRERPEPAPLVSVAFTSGA